MSPSGPSVSTGCIAGVLAGPSVMPMLLSSGLNTVMYNRTSAPTRKSGVSVAERIRPIERLRRGGTGTGGADELASGPEVTGPEGGRFLNANGPEVAGTTTGPDTGLVSTGP